MEGVASARAAAAEQRAAAAERRAELLLQQLDTQQQMLEAAACRASEAEAQLEQLQGQLKRAQAGHKEGLLLWKPARLSGDLRQLAPTSQKLATQQVGAAAAADHVAAVEAALMRLVSGPLAVKLPAAAAAAILGAASRAQAAAADLARLMQQQAQLEQDLQQSSGSQEWEGEAVTPRADVCRRLWIGGVTRRPSEREVLAAVEKFGAVDSVRVFLQRRCAFVDFADADSAASAKRALHGRALPQLSGSRELTVQYQKSDPPRPFAIGGPAAAAAAGGRAAAPAPAPAPRSSKLSVSAPAWQPPSAHRAQHTQHDLGPLPPPLPETIDWEAAADAAWAAVGGEWDEDGECEWWGGDSGSAAHGEDGKGEEEEEEEEESGHLDQPELFLPSELLDADDAPAVSAPTPPLLPMPLPLTLFSDSAADYSSSALSSTSSAGSGEMLGHRHGQGQQHSSGQQQQQQQQQQGHGQARGQGWEADAPDGCHAPSRSLWVGRTHPQSRWKPADFQRRVEVAFSSCGVVEAVDVPKGKTFCFVHFEDATSAGRALEALQGALVPDLAEGPLEIKYCRSSRPRAWGA